MNAHPWTLTELPRFWAARVSDSGVSLCLEGCFYPFLPKIYPPSRQIYFAQPILLLLILQSSTPLCLFYVKRKFFWAWSQNHWMFGVGRALCGSPSPTPLLKQGHPEQAAEDLVQAGLEYLQRRRLHSLPEISLTKASERPCRQRRLQRAHHTTTPDAATQLFLFSLSSVFRMATIREKKA